MTHEEAVASQAPERYVLGELSEQAREALEDHFFECPECARDVRACAALLANVREEDSGRRRPMLRRGRRFLVPAALVADLLLAAFTAYLTLVRVPALEQGIAALRTAQGYTAVFLRPVVRGDEQQIALRPGTQFLGLAVDLPPGDVQPAYVCELFEETGRRAAAIEVNAPARPGEP